MQGNMSVSKISTCKHCSGRYQHPQTRNTDRRSCTSPSYDFETNKHRTRSTSTLPQNKKHTTQQEERAAAIKIQTRARGMSAKKQRARHATRVGSIRDSGRAAADDLRALSRPNTAAETSAGGATSQVAVPGARNASSSSSGGRRSRTAGPSKPGFGGEGVGGMLEMAAAIALTDIRPPPNTAASKVAHSSDEQQRARIGRSSASAGSSPKRVAGGGGGGGGGLTSPPRKGRSRSTVSTPGRRYVWKVNKKNYPSVVGFL